MINALITLLVIGIIVALVIYVVDALTIPDPLGRFIKIAAVVIGVLAVVVVLLRMIGVDVGTPVALP